jgi:hypothetical protein
MARALPFLLVALPLAVACQGSGIPLYETCGTGADCEDAADDCYTVAWEDGRDGTMCSLSCADHSDCPGNSACYELVGDPSMRRVCFRRCEVNGDCPSDYQCVNAEEGGVVVDAICLPSSCAPGGACPSG